MAAGDDDADPEIAETARLARIMPADETQLLYSLCLHGRGELGLAPDEYAALTMVLLRLLAFKPSGVRVSAIQAVTSGSAAEPGKKPQPEPVKASVPAVPKRAEAAQTVAPLAELVAEVSPGKIQASHDALAHIDRASIAMNSEAPVDPSAAPAQPPQALVPSASLAASPLGDAWSQTVNHLVAAEAVAALTRELALQSELCSQAGSVWTLRVERESLNQPAAREKLQAALQQALGDPALKLAVKVGVVADSPARRNAAGLAERQRAAEEMIHND